MADTIRYDFPALRLSSTDVLHAVFTVTTVPGLAFNAQLRFTDRNEKLTLK